MKKYTLEQLQKAVDDWNTNHPIGTPVRRYALMNPRGGETTDTHTRSVAWVMGDHSAVVNLVGFSGCMALDQIEVIEAEKSAIPPVEACPPPAPPDKPRAGAFFFSDIQDAVSSVYEFADAFGTPESAENFVKGVIEELQKPRE